MSPRWLLLTVPIVSAAPILARIAPPAGQSIVAPAGPQRLASNVQRPLEDQVADLTKRLAATEAKLKLTTEQADKAMFLANAVVASSDQQGRDLKKLTNAYNQHHHDFTMNDDTGVYKWFHVVRTSIPAENCKEIAKPKLTPDGPQSSTFNCTPPDPL